jgi:hypothetical protein
MIDRTEHPPRLPRIAGALLVGLAVALVSTAALADHRGGHGGGRRGGGHVGFAGPFHPGFHHFHSFVFVGAGVGYPYYAGYYPYYPTYYLPPTYISPTDCYNTVPRAPGVADLYTCAGQYVGPVAVP